MLAKLKRHLLVIILTVAVVCLLLKVLTGFVLDVVLSLIAYPLFGLAGWITVRSWFRKPGS